MKPPPQKSTWSWICPENCEIQLYECTYRDGPEVDEHEHDHEQSFVKREEEGEDVVWHALRPTVDRVEGVRGIRCGEAVGVMRLVNVAIQEREVQSSMDKVDGHVCAEEEQRNGEEEISPAVLVNVVVHLAVALSDQHRERRHEH